IVGIFPEGGVVRGTDAVFRGGPMKRGVCVVGIRAGVPVVPVVVLGTERLNSVSPWLPARRGRLWIAFGREIQPPPLRPGVSRRGARFQMADQIQSEFIRAYRELLSHSGLADAQIP